MWISVCSCVGFIPLFINSTNLYFVPGVKHRSCFRDTVVNIMTTGPASQSHGISRKTNTEDANKSTTGFIHFFIVLFNLQMAAAYLVQVRSVAKS